MEQERILNGWKARGYRFLQVNGVSIPEHRYVMAQHLGRPLRRDEHIHHRNHDRSDNRLENLKIVTLAEHTSLHRSHRKPCWFCGADDSKQVRGACGLHYRQFKRELYHPRMTWAAIRLIEKQQYAHDTREVERIS